MNEGTPELQEASVHGPPNPGVLTARVRLGSPLPGWRLPLALSTPTGLERGAQGLQSAAAGRMALGGGMDEACRRDLLPRGACSVTGRWRRPFPSTREEGHKKWAYGPQGRLGDLQGEMRINSKPSPACEATAPACGQVSAATPAPGRQLALPTGSPARQGGARARRTPRASRAARGALCPGRPRSA